MLNMTILACTVILIVVACTVVEKSLTKIIIIKTLKGDGREDGRDGSTYRRTDRRTDVNQYTPTFSKRGIKNNGKLILVDLCSYAVK